MKKKISIVILSIIFLTIPISYATDLDDALDNQKEEFKIEEFIESAKDYGGEVFEDVNISELLSDAIKGEIDNSTFLKKVWNLFRK